MKHKLIGDSLREPNPKCPNCGHYLKLEHWFIDGDYFWECLNCYARYEKLKEAEK